MLSDLSWNDDAGSEIHSMKLVWLMLWLLTLMKDTLKTVWSKFYLMLMVIPPAL